MILKISLKPQHKFFFGAEASFNDGSTSDRRATYVLHSRHYPQQTGVLGLIRNQLLLQNDLLWDNSARVSDKSKAKALIGAHGFQVGYQGNYGVIQSISTIHLEDGQGQQWVAAPRDDVKGKDSALVFKAVGSQHYLQGYSEKAGLSAQLRSPKKQNQSLEDAFKAIEQVGITKAARPWDRGQVVERDDEEAYYYQTFFTFNRAAEIPIERFSFYVKLADSHQAEGHHYSWHGQANAGTLPYTLQDAMVEFGGERSSFFMEVEPTNLVDFPVAENCYLHTEVDPGVQTRRLVCQSPCAVDIALLRPLSQLIVSESLSFRFFRSKVDETLDYQSLQRDASAKQYNSPVESYLYELLDRGSVIYFDPAQQTAITKLFDRDDFKIIGYNQYSIL